jgi:hypothetical protein
MEKFELGNTGLDPTIRTPNDANIARFGHLNIIVDAITELQEVPPGSGLQSVQAGTNITIDDSDVLNPIINANISTLQEVSDAGGFDNGSTLREGLIPHGYGGGISRVCANSKEDQWEDGVKYLIQTTGSFTSVVYTENINNVNPGDNDDETLFYAIGSRWKNLVTGIEFICTSASTNNAEWLPLSGQWTPTGSADGSCVDNAVFSKSYYSVQGNMVTCSVSGSADFNFVGFTNGFIQLTNLPIETNTFYPIGHGGTQANMQITFLNETKIRFYSNDNTINENLNFIFSFQYEIN